MVKLASYFVLDFFKAFFGAGKLGRFFVCNMHFLALEAALLDDLHFVYCVLLHVAEDVEDSQFFGERQIVDKVAFKFFL